MGWGADLISSAPASGSAPSRESAGVNCDGKGFHMGVVGCLFSWKHGLCSVVSRLGAGEAGIHFICMFFRSAITAWLAAEFSVKGPAF